MNGNLFSLHTNTEIALGYIAVVSRSHNKKIMLDMAPAKQTNGWDNGGYDWDEVEDYEGWKTH